MLGILFDGETKVGTFQQLTIDGLYNIQILSQYIDISNRKTVGKLHLISAKEINKDIFELISDYKMHQLIELENVWVGERYSTIEKARLCG
jgi:hypothetical protein